MVSAMKLYVEAVPELNNDERNMLSVGYKNVVSTLRKSWRDISAIEQHLGGIASAAGKYKIAHDYRLKIEGELRAICFEILVSL